MENDDEVRKAMLEGVADTPEQPADDPVRAEMLKGLDVPEALRASPETMQAIHSVSKNPIGVATESAASIGGNALGSAVGGARGLWDYVSGTYQRIKNLQEGKPDVNIGEKAAEDVRASQERFTPPVSESTKDFLSAPWNPINWIPAAGRKAGDVTLDVTGSPAAAAAAETLVNAAPMAAGVRASKLTPTGEPAPTLLSVEDSGKSALTRLVDIDRAMKAKVDAAYDKVTNSAGRSVNLDGEHFYMNAQAALEHENVQQFIPKEIANLYDDYTSGRLPLTVDTMRSFDKVLSRAARTTTDGNVEHAVNIIRKALNETPVASDAGAETIAAYKQARNLARQRFELADPSSQNYVPAYAAMRKAVGKDSLQQFQAALENGTANVDPAKWLEQNVVKGTPAGVKKLTTMLQQTGAGDEIGSLQQGVLSHIRDQVTSKDTVSSAKVARLLTQRRSTLANILTPEQIGKLDVLASVKEEAPKGPITEAAVNLAKGSVPFVSPALALKDLVSGRMAANKARAAAETTLNPPTTPPMKRLVPGYVGKGVPLVQLLGTQPEEAPQE